MANKNITIPVKDIKRVMKDLYELYFENGDRSYHELTAAISTFRDAGLISEEEYRKLFEFDHKLFRIICGVK